jgi:rSAM/selenodomain-associated transferase 1
MSKKATDKAILIMAKPPELGKVKTRLAKSVGNQKALDIYKLLLRNTFLRAGETGERVVVFYTDDFDISLADNFGFEVEYQSGKDLGEKMMNVFWWAFQNDIEHAVLIGADCYDISSSLLDKAFSLLKLNDLVFGPANDGGYYLIGMNELHESLFKNKPWSTENVLHFSLKDAAAHNLSYALVDELVDVDTIEDLEKTKLKEQL